jgi:hypothetical protein
MMPIERMLRPVVFLMIAGISSAFVSLLGAVVGDWGGSWLLTPSLGALGWMLLALSFPVFLLYFASRQAAIACSWTLAGANTIFALIMYWYPCMIQQHCGSYGLFWMTFKTLGREPGLWGIYISSLAMQLASTVRKNENAAIRIGSGFV